MAASDQTYLEVRSRICDTFLVWLSIAAIAMLAASLYRVVDIGWQPIMTLHIFVASALWATALCRKHLPYHVRGGFLLGLMLIVGLAGTWSFGLAAGGLVWLLITPVISAILFGARSGLAILACIILATSMIGVMTVLGIKSPALDLTVYISSASTWINSELAWVLTIGGAIFAIGMLNKFFIESLETSRRQAEGLEESEREYRSILDNMVDTFYRADQEGRVVMASPSAMGLLGLAPEELTGRKLTEFYVDESQRAEFLRHLEEGGGEVTDYDAEIYTKSGEKIWVSTSARYWKDAAGKILGVEGAIRNTTAHKAAEEVLLRSRKMEAVGQLTGGIAHDYNNMLGVIMGNIQLIQGSAELDDRTQRRLNMALAAAQRNADLTGKLLGLSRAQAGGTRLIAANDFIVRLEDIIAKSLTASIEVRTELAEDLWPVDVDPGEFEDMLLNLAINARDAMPGGGVLAFGTANVTFDDRDMARNPNVRAGDYVMISLSDTGSGMSAEIREKIFDPFFSTKEIGKGTGLGLSLVYAFVQRSGGFIILHSEPGEGASFGIFLPRAHDGKSDATGSPTVADHELPRGTETVLVVDDESFLVDIAVALLDDLGYQTFTASDARQALDVLKANPGIDLLFSDVVMPGELDGYGLALAAGQLCPSLQVLLTSGFAKISEEHMNGGNEVVARLTANRLSKPYTLIELATAVRRTLDEGDQGATAQS